MIDTAERPIPPSIERFRVLRLLGTGAQGAVYLAHDPVLDRRVAIKTFTDEPLSDAAAQEALMNEARIVSRFKHPHIVPIYEAGHYEHGVYLVFEYVEGDTLAQLLERGPLPIERALAVMRDVLDAVAAAHEQHILHRDLKPANVLIGSDGRARIADFGIAMPVEAVSEANRLWGTPRYLSPEQLDGRPVTERADVFALGVLLYEMLTGRKAFDGSTTQEVLEQVTARELKPPSLVCDGGDERFDALILRATRKAPDERFASAVEFREAFAEAVHTGGDGNGGGSLDFVMRRIRRKPDFPGISSHIREITQCSGDASRRSVGELSNAVLKDYATTQKLLRLANSSYYGNFGGNIHTVSRAIVVLGFEQVRTTALGLVLFENLKSGRHSSRLMEALLGSLFSAMLARNLARDLREVDSEQAFVCTLFHDLGRMLVLYYFPEEADEIRILTEQDVAQDTAAKQVLGVSYERLARTVLEDWNFPREIVTAVERAPAGTLPAAPDPARKLHRITTLASEMAQTIMQANPDLQDARLAALQKRYKQALSIDSRRTRKVMQDAREDLERFLSVVKLPKEGQAQLIRLQANLGVGQVDDDTVVGMIDEAETPTATEQPVQNPEQQVATLMEGLTEMLGAMVGDFELNALLQSALENVYRTLNLRRILLMLSDAERTTLVAHTAFGHDAETLAGRLRLNITGGRDILSLVMHQGKDLVITDSRDAKISKYIPKDFSDVLDARSFLLLPLLIRDRSIGMLYLELRGSQVLDDKVVNAVKALRNQTALAIREARGSLGRMKDEG
ncbi:serine/threonine protein kinase [Thioalkalivibrio denitrificans]|uniref:Serine/threonine protein kinase n=1 Tax=Thioalkalivibrio denitrificans TaxID=108003 RepID=A0A1V3NM39_9GAMM|nr:serine/threonine protein kinase [Thioalkalivibrio denitrificans]OOG25938.1 serine/threonine protein kinase [Thioalkalivibrio denitrificans]